jgi:hypothetical protein
MNRKLIFALAIALITIAAVIGALVGRNKPSKSVPATSIRTPKLDTTPPKFPE